MTADVVRARLRDGALVLAGLAALVGSPRPPGGGREVSAAELQEGRGGLSVIQVAQWVRDRREDLVLVDVRSREAFHVFHIPTSRWADLEETLAAPSGLRGTVVLVGDGGPLAAQAWLLLQGQVSGPVYYLDGGVNAWLTTLLSPVLPADATPEERVAWVDVAEVSRYFGGMPLRGGAREDGAPPPWFTPPAGAAQRVDALVEAARRRGCGF